MEAHDNAGLDALVGVIALRQIRELVSRMCLL